MVAIDDETQTVRSGQVRSGQVRSGRGRVMIGSSSLRTPRALSVAAEEEVSLAACRLSLHFHDMLTTVTDHIHSPVTATLDRPSPTSSHRFPARSAVTAFGQGVIDLS